MGCARVSVYCSCLFITLLGCLDSVRGDTIFVWSWDGSITRFATNGSSSVLGNLSGWNGPVGLTTDADGNLITGSPSDSRIRRFFPDGSSVIIGMVDSVSALAYDSAAVLYASIPNYTEICRPAFTAGYGYYTLPGTDHTQSNLSYPTGLAIDTNGIIFVANGIGPFGQSTNYPANSVVKFSKSFEFLGVVATNLGNPFGLAFDAAGNLFVSSQARNRIYKITPDGQELIYASTSRLRGPQGLAFDASGNLYVANSLSNNVLKFSASGLTEFATGLLSPSAIAVSPGLRKWEIPKTKLVSASKQPDGSFYFSFKSSPDLRFEIESNTNGVVSNEWSNNGIAAEIFSGDYYFYDRQATNSPAKYYRVVR